MDIPAVWASVGMPVSSRNQRSTSSAWVRAEAARAHAGAATAPLGDQQVGDQRGGFDGHVEGGKVGDHAGSWRRGSFLRRNRSSIAGPRASCCDTLSEPLTCLFAAEESVQPLIR